jgi:hypothetical protein
VFAGESQQDALEKLLEDVGRERERLAKAREGAARIRAPGADVLFARIEQGQLLEQIESLAERVATDPDARGELDRKLRKLAALIDHLEDATEWREAGVGAANEWGTGDEKRLLRKPAVQTTVADSQVVPTHGEKPGPAPDEGQLPSDTQWRNGPSA